MTTQKLFAISAIMIVCSIVIGVTAYHMGDIRVMWSLLAPLAACFFITIGDEFK
jgi:hypothetical protein